MAQNIYDKQAFFDEYTKLSRNVEGLNGAIEWPTLQSMVGDMKDANILDLGCGLGHFCRYAIESGAHSVHGIDLSSNMLTKAKAFPTNIDTAERITYEQQDLENLQLEDSKYDLVYSCFAFHYLPRAALDHVFIQIAQCLKSSGRLVFAVMHPMWTAPSNPGWKETKAGAPFWPLDSYFDEKARIIKWLSDDNVRMYHHTVETYVSLVLRHKFVLTGFRESWDGMPKPWEPEKMEDFRGFHVPFFLMISARMAATT